MKFLSNDLNIGVKDPFSFIHISDTHLTYADTRDNERKNKLAIDDSKIFPTGKNDLEAAAEIAKRMNTFIAHTGDLIDFVSYANLDAVKKFTDENDCFMAAGNHEFSLYVGEAVEDAAYRNQSLEKVQQAFKNNIRFASRIVNGVNFIAVDNGYYLFESWQLKALKAEADKKLPILLFLHTPLYNEEIYHFSRKVRKRTAAFLMSVPEEKMKDYPSDRYAQQKEDETTAEAFSYVKTEPLIKAVFTGHIHVDFETMLTENLPQFTTGIGTIRKINVY